MPPRPTSPSLFSDPTDSQPASNTERSSWINAHCDGGARGNPGPAGFGALIQDDHGTVLAELSDFLGIRTNNYAEYSGLLASLQYALDHHHPRLRVVSDSELMVKQIQGKYKVNSPDLRPLWQEARNRIARLEAFEISHALRHKNKDADRLANEAMDRGMKDRGTKDIGMMDRGMMDRGTKDRGMKSPETSTPGKKNLSSFDAVGGPASRTETPLKAQPYPKKSEAPPDPYAKADTMLRGFTKNGAIHLLGNATLPDGVFVKIIRE